MILLVFKNEKEKELKKEEVVNDYLKKMIKILLFMFLFGFQIMYI